MLKRFILGGAVLAAVLTAVSLAGGLGRGATASVQLDPEEQAFMVLLNDYRAQNGLGALSIDSSIQSAAEWMSTDMGEKDYFSHTDSLGRSPWDRMCDFGYCYNTWKGENIAAGYATAEAAFDAWRNSPGHNSNMLSDNYLVTGIALVHTPGSTYNYYWTNDFGGYQAEASPPPAPTNTPSPTPSPTPTASPTTPAPTETPSPTPSASPSPSFVRADVNCDEEVTAADALALLRYVGGLSNETPPGCPAIGEGSSGAQPASGGPALQGDVDCNSVVDAADARSVLLSASDVATLPYCDA
ncbi:MAG: hypothetical protein IH863_05805 [Chloroflexi bacterium]|nr:hypothetical protein [Chloroflexota bacterium]